MNTTGLQNSIAGLVIYVVCITLAALPIFPVPMSLSAVAELCAAAIAASMVVAVVRYSGAARLFKDPGAMFTQAVLGISVCSGLYSILTTDSRPEVMFMSFLLWTATGLMCLTPARVAVLFALSVGIYLNDFATDSRLFASVEGRSETIFMLLASALMASFMCWRARAYTRVRNEKARLREQNTKQAEQIEQAESRIHAMTVQDMDTIALKYPYFRSALVAEKTRTDKSGGTFSIGLIGIDHFEAIRTHYGEVAAKQLLREFADRTTKLVRKMDFLQEYDDGFQPLGRVGDSLFGLVLPGANIKGAHHCVDHLQKAAEFHNIQTEAGPITVTLSIGVIEYRRGDNVDALMDDLARALEKARLAHERELVEQADPNRVQGKPIKGASASHEMMLLDYKDYSRPVH
jgi:diguanylate cyclase (GGDEF)-like protein